MQILDTDTPTILLAIAISILRVPKEEFQQMEELERRIQALRGTDFEQINKDNTMSKDTLFELIEAASAVVSNHEHAFSGGMCSYQKGSDTWQLFENLRTANDAAATAFRAGKVAAGREAWHKAILAECTSIGACYQESDPAKTVADLIDWHRKDAVWHSFNGEAGRVAASPAPPAEMADEPIYQILQSSWYGIWKDVSQTEYDDYENDKRVLYTVAHPVAQKADAEPVGELFTDGWMQSGSLLYRLTNDRRPQNCDEINVTMADGSRADDARVAKATYILNLLGSAQAPAPTDAERLDAKRYQWLREQHWSDAPLFVTTGPHSTMTLGTYCPSRAQLDTEIDAAMAAKDAA